MAIKWKNFTRNCWVKAVAVILLMVSAGVSAYQATSFANYVNNTSTASLLDDRMLFYSESPSSTWMDRQLFDAYRLLYRINMGTESYISSGSAVDEEELCQRIYNVYFDTFYNNDDVSEEFSNETAQSMRTIYPAEAGTEGALTDQQITDLIARAYDSGIIEDTDSANFRLWLSYNRGVYTAMRQRIITQQLDALAAEDLPTDLENYDYYAYCENTNTTLTNLNAADAAAAQKILSANNYPMITALYPDQDPVWSGSAITQEDVQYFSDIPSRIPENFSDSDILLIGLKQTAWDTLQQQWRETSAAFRTTAAIIGASALVALLCFILLCFGAGRKTREDGIHLIWFDRVWTEVQFTLGCIILIAGFGSITFLFDGYTYIPEQGEYAITIAACMLMAAVLLGLILAQIRRIKTHKWLDGFIIWRVLHHYVGRSLRWLVNQFRQSTLRRRVILACFLVPLGCAVWPLLPFIIVGLLFFFLREAERFETVVTGATDIRAGKTDTHIAINGGSKELRALADDLNGIADGLNNAVSTAVKSERLKSELISNVSHDIKTPLTSIITYIDLLKKCNLSDPDAREYVDTLDQKAQRLRILTGDLFDASKATSGAMKVDLMQTDFDALLQQALGERSEHLEKANLDVRIQSKPPIYVNADGRLLWRILDNLLSNCGRYALPGSRVYITIEPEGDMVSLTMKNISAHELNISSEELMERFTRGDRARHTEGSGLGLSIAKSLAELMGGSCRVEIDGDLFKSIVTIPKWNPMNETKP